MAPPKPSSLADSIGAAGPKMQSTANGTARAPCDLGGAGKAASLGFKRHRMGSPLSSLQGSEPGSSHVAVT